MPVRDATRPNRRGASASDRGGREDDFDLRWEEPSRRGGGSREDRPADEPLLGGLRGEEDPLAAFFYDGFISDADAPQ